MKTFGSERGFTLAEVLTALMILSLLAVTAIPAFAELRIRHQAQDQRFEAVLLIQEQMERLQRERVVPPLTRRWRSVVPRRCFGSLSVKG